MVDEPDQDEVLRKKGGVTKSSRGLQIWDEDALGGEGIGDAGSGTAERAAHIARGQHREEREGEGEREE